MATAQATGAQTSTAELQRRLWDIDAEYESLLYAVVNRAERFGWDDPHVVRGDATLDRIAATADTVRAELLARDAAEEKVTAA